MASGTFHAVYLYYIDAYGESCSQFPVGMGTGAVYLTLSGLKNHADVVTNVETAFYILNMVLFCLNSTTLLLQLICELVNYSFSFPARRSLLLVREVYPRQALRIVTDPSKGVFVPLIVNDNVL